MKGVAQHQEPVSHALIYLLLLMSRFKTCWPKQDPSVAHTIKPDVCTLSTVHRPDFVPPSETIVDMMTRPTYPPVTCNTVIHTPATGGAVATWKRPSGPLRWDKATAEGVVTLLEDVQPDDVAIHPDRRQIAISGEGAVYLCIRQGNGTRQWEHERVLSDLRGKVMVDWYPDERRLIVMTTVRKPRLKSVLHVCDIGEERRRKLEVDHWPHASVAEAARAAVTHLLDGTQWQDSTETTEKLNAQLRKSCRKPDRSFLSVTFPWCRPRSQSHLVQRPFLAMAHYTFQTTIGMRLLCTMQPSCRCAKSSS